MKEKTKKKVLKVSLMVVLLIVFVYVTFKTTKLMATKDSKYECLRCGWIYDPAEGDPEGGIAPGTPFKDIPNNWKCPVCGASKSDFAEYPEN